MRGCGRAAEAAAGGVRDQAGGPDAEPVSDERRRARPLQPRAGCMSAPVRATAAGKTPAPARAQAPALAPVQAAPHFSVLDASRDDRAATQSAPLGVGARRAAVAGAVQAGRRSSRAPVPAQGLSRWTAWPEGTLTCCRTARVLRRASAVGGAGWRAWRARESCWQGGQAQCAGSSRPWAARWDAWSRRRGVCGHRVVCQALCGRGARRASRRPWLPQRG